MSMSPAASLASLTRYFTSSADQARPSAWAVSLHTGAPGNNGVDNEVTDSGYARQSAQFQIDNSDPVGPTAVNSATIAFPVAQAGYTATHVVVWDATNNQPLAIQRLVTDKIIAGGQQAQFTPSQLKIGGRN